MENSKTYKMLNYTRKALADSLKNKYNITDDDIIDNILKVHGLHINNFDVIKNAGLVIKEKINDVSIDSNSNKNDKFIETINQESVSSAKKAIGYDYLFNQMQDMYGNKEANRLIGNLMDYSIGMHDATNICKVYCYALDASSLVTTGRPFGQLSYRPAKSVPDYISSLSETVHQLSSHLAGAVAIGSFFLDIAHICIYDEKFKIGNIRSDEEVRKYIRDEMSQFVYSVNNLSRNSTESPFTNISVFDRNKLKTLIKDRPYYFPNEGERTLSDHIDYITEYIIELQKLFVDFFDKGDPSTGGTPFRFPICTLNISKDGNENVKDKEFLEDVCKLDIYRYNIFVSDSNKIASCCRLISNKEMLEFASQANSFGGSSISLGSHRVCTIDLPRVAIEAKDISDFYKILDGLIEDTAKILSAHKKLIIGLEKMGLQPFISNGWININRLFSTFGIIGTWETASIFKEKFGNGHDVEGLLLKHINSKVTEESKLNGIIGNIEAIPGESFAIRLVKVDKMIFGADKVKWTMYSNQFIPLWEDATIWERMDADGKYTQLITGGGIVHAQIGEKVTSKQAEHIIKYAIRSGCEHFALNAVYSKCENDHITFGESEKCPTCSANIIDHYTRIVGYFSPVSNWHKTRREWEFPKRTFVKLDT
jgi:ribonucleoside-triphosphate reductase